MNGLTRGQLPNLCIDIPRHQKIKTFRTSKTPIEKAIRSDAEMRALCSTVTPFSTELKIIDPLMLITCAIGTIIQMFMFMSYDCDIMDY